MILRRTPGGASGFILLEILIAGVILGVVIIGLSLMFRSGLQATLGDGDYRLASFLAEKKLEQLQAAGFGFLPPTGTVVTTDVYLCTDGTINPGSQCPHPNEGPKFTMKTCVRSVIDGNPDSPPSPPPSCTNCSGGGCTGYSNRIWVTVTPARPESAPVMLEAVMTPTCWSASPSTCP